MTFLNLFGYGCIIFRFIWKKNINNSFISQALCKSNNLFFFFSLHHIKRRVHQVSDHRLNISSNITNFSKLTCFNFYKRSTSKSSQPPGNLSFSNPGRAYHYYVIRHNLITHITRNLLPSPSVSHCNCYRFFRFSLSNNILIKLSDDLFRS